MRHPNSARFHEILKEHGELHDRKQADYGRFDDPFANVRASVEWGVPGWVGAMVRLNDKVRRLQALACNGTLHNEGAIDSFRDIAVYATIAQVLFEQEAAALQDDDACVLGLTETPYDEAHRRVRELPETALPELYRVLADLEGFYRATEVPTNAQA